jgi:hypothetical protein
MTLNTNDAGLSCQPHEEIIIDGQKYPAVHEPLTGRRVLDIAGRHPIDEYLVLWLGPDNVLQDLGLDQTIHPEHQKFQEFFTFKSDRLFILEIEGRREEWGAPFITEETLRKLGGATKECCVLQEVHDRPQRILKPGDRVDLGVGGIERFRVECPTKITVVNEDNGKILEFSGFNETKVSELIEEMYRRLGLARQRDDRLRCEGGSDVFQYAELTLAVYVDAGHCRCLVWLFAAGTGGAACQ